MSGAEYAYILLAFRPLHKHYGSIPAFLFSWVNALLLRPAQMAIITVAFATYAIQGTELFDACGVAEQKQVIRGVAVISVCKWFVESLVQCMINSQYSVVVNLSNISSLKDVFYQ